MYVFILSRLICLFIHLLFIFVSIFSRRWATKFLETSNFNGKKKSFSTMLWTSWKFLLISPRQVTRRSFSFSFSSGHLIVFFSDHSNAGVCPEHERNWTCCGKTSMTYHSAFVLPCGSVFDFATILLESRPWLVHFQYTIIT